MNTWLLPDGITESLPSDAEKHEALRRQLLDLYATWGYHLVMPPLVEYLESLRAGMGTQLDLQTFKITDQINGRMMGIRADITPQVARIDAHRLSKGNAKAAVNRLCYIGTVLRTRSAQQGGSRAPVQVGAEIFGHAGVESDYEIISLMLETLNSIQISDVILDMGHIGVVNGLAEHVGLSKAQQNDYFDMLARKSIPEIQTWVANESIDAVNSIMLLELPLLNGSVEIIETAKLKLEAAGSKVKEALAHLQKITKIVTANFPDLPLNLDLAEMRGYSYHTGITYAAYQAGRGDAIAQGGRYDGIGEAFGNNRPAIGFSADLSVLAALVDDQSLAINANQAIIAPAKTDPQLSELIASLRSQGEAVIRQLEGESQEKALSCNRKIEKQGDAWVVVTI
ncbi:MAG: ATP phosphoribosyltransferase regulatory subunit [Cocleimonas sp.]|jgi:ATP phosphoribosyltransferase regulatory subunit